ncbi:acyltransferase [Microbacterium sp. PAMC 28756]|uniref:DUF418 domain-containing protein n=1 Tax=Microbacterium TaxID=33882 RepID=UPI0006873C90|nr:MULTISPECIES: heparan-alpha-glucosaminide N-acetyltransferase domain-containing protein [unclassified Microbacterium]AMG82907.1 acyltransferase [Microbacterium sp. PAMC 28756]RBO70808.1 DUF1624 domain-containing protein [Microbacterium sp. H6]
MPHTDRPRSPGSQDARTPLRERFAVNWARLHAEDRIPGIDLARGMAVVGMFAAHLLWITPLVWSDPGTWTGIVQGRSSILFATLAGVSLGVMAGGARRPSPAELPALRARLVYRSLLLWLLGVVLLGLGIPVYIILPAYAILFLLALPFLPLRPRQVLIVAGGIGLLAPFLQAWVDALPWWETGSGRMAAWLLGWHYPFPVWIAFVLAGLGLARTDIRRLRTQLAMLGAGIALAVLGYGLDAVSGTRDVPDDGAFWDVLWTAEPHSSGLLEVIGSGGFAIAAISVCLLACRTPLIWITLPLRATGSMPLTAYVTQLLLWAVLASIGLGTTGDLGAFRDTAPFWPLTIATITGCTVWALLIGRGPLERAMTHLPARRSTSSGRSIPRDDAHRP